MLGRVDEAAYAEGFDGGINDRRVLLPAEDVTGGHGAAGDPQTGLTDLCSDQALPCETVPGHTIYPELAALAADETPLDGDAPRGASPAVQGFCLPDRWVALIEALDDPALFDVMMEGARA